MNISDRLDAMRNEFPCCSLVSFGDLSTGLALRTSARRQHKQDYLEHLLRQAKHTYDLSDAYAERYGHPTLKKDQIQVATSEDFRVFIRSETCASDVICYIFSEPVNPQQVCRSAQNLFQRISGAA